MGEQTSENKPLPVAIAGGAGRMGQTLRQVLEDDKRFVLAGSSEVQGSAYLTEDSGSEIRSADPETAARHATVWVDFTRPDITLAAADALQETGVHGLVIGTTGFSDEEQARLEALSSRFAIVKAGNFSLGIAMLCALVRDAAARLGPGWDAEILETHHRFKVDAPSGTALMLGEAVAKGRGAPLPELRQSPYDGADARRSPGGIGFSVRRGGGVIGDHDVSFHSLSETLSFRHSAIDRSVFARGALEAALWVADKPPGFYTIEDVLGIES